jgi:hypothetical protein
MQQTAEPADAGPESRDVLMNISGFRVRSGCALAPRNDKDKKGPGFSGAFSLH